MGKVIDKGFTPPDDPIFSKGIIVGQLLNAYQLISRKRERQEALKYPAKAESEPLILDPKNELPHQLSFRESYVNTSFWVEMAEYSIRLRVGEHNPLLDDLLARFSADAWAYITAFNPRSQRLTADENQRRQQELRAVVEELGYATLPGRGIGDVGAWPAEQSNLILGIEELAARTLGERFSQNAILIGRRGAAPALLWC